jgi:hypothetical protein
MMMRRVPLVLWLALVAAACHDAPAPRAPEAAQSLPGCCTGAELDRLAGEKVRLVGVYQALVVSQRGDAKPDLSEAGAAGVKCESGQLVMLGVYHRPEGVRPSAERRQYDGRRVEVVGVLERRTPTEVSQDGQPAATMINPYLHSIESVRAAE